LLCDLAICVIGFCLTMQAASEIISPPREKQKRQKSPLENSATQEMK
jgi:hypothetical protein